MPCGLDPSSSLLLSGLVDSRPVSEFFRFGPPAVTRRTLRPNPCSTESGLSSRFKARDRPISSAATVGLNAIPVKVEVDIEKRGFPAFTIVGLPDKAVEESRERVRSAIVNTKADFPDYRITVNLAPADLKKEGSYYDLPIAMGILIASGQIDLKSEEIMVLGELSLV